MSKVTLDLDVKEAKEMIKQMPLDDKVELVRILQKETWGRRIDGILKNIDRRRAKSKISSKEISQEIEKARKEFYAPRHH